MSVAVYRMLMCDWGDNDCGEERGPATNQRGGIAAVRKWAVENAGWVHRDGKDYCPKHAHSGRSDA